MFNTKTELLLEKGVLVQQALSNAAEQFASSPVLQTFFMDALIESYSARNALDRAALKKRFKLLRIWTHFQLVIIAPQVNN